MLCVSIAAPTAAAARAAASSALRNGAALAEIRLDAISGLTRDDLRSICSGLGDRLILTDPSPFHSRLLSWLESPSDDEARAWLDAGDSPVRRPRTIFSWHDFHSTPSAKELGDIWTRLRRLAEGCRPAVLKLAASARSLEEALRMAALAAAKNDERGAEDPETLAIAMGPWGTFTRILYRRFGAPWTYAAPDPEPRPEGTSPTPTAPGQLPLSLLRDRYRADRIGPSTRLFGLLGDPVEHSRSPEIFNHAFRTWDLDAAYVPVRIDRLDAFPELQRLTRAEGWSVTVPHKEGISRFCSDLSADAEAIGAVNTLQAGREGLLGFNTDAFGLAETLRAGLEPDGMLPLLRGGESAHPECSDLRPGQALPPHSHPPFPSEGVAKVSEGVRSAPRSEAEWRMAVPRASASGPGLSLTVAVLNVSPLATPPSGRGEPLTDVCRKRGVRSVLILGAGGAARAALHVCLEAGLAVTLASRTLERARRLVGGTEGSAVPWERRTDVAADLVLNATPVGMEPDSEATPWPADAWRRGQIAFDTVYTPPMTRFLREARAAGVSAIPGTGMFFAQADAQSRIWFGRSLPLSPSATL